MENSLVQCVCVCVCARESVCVCVCMRVSAGNDSPDGKMRTPSIVCVCI